MTRSLFVLAAIVAALIGGIWTHEATRDGSRPTAETTSAPTAVSLAAPADPAPTPVTARAEAPRPGKRSAPARPEDVSRDAEPELREPEHAAPPSAAMRIAADPVTGQLVAPEHSGPVVSIDEIQEIVRQEAEGLITIRNADGSETLNHEGRFADYTVIRVGRVLQCVHGRSGVRHALRHAAPVTPTLGDR